jgi:hypothetical protein
VGVSPWPEITRLAGLDPSSVVTKKPSARAPAAFATSRGTAAGSWVASSSPSIQPRHCTVLCGWLSLKEIAVLRSTSRWVKGEKARSALFRCSLKLTPTSRALGRQVSSPVAARGS